MTRDLHSLYLPVRRNLLAFLDYANLHIDTEGMIEPFETLRTEDRQAVVLQNGRSKVKTGLHQMGLAVDVWPSLRDGSWPDPKYLNAWPNWNTLGTYGKAFGFTWGGDWDNDGSSEDEKFLDRVHFEMTFEVKKEMLEYIYLRAGIKGVWEHLDAILENKENVGNLLKQEGANGVPK